MDKQINIQEFRFSTANGGSLIYFEPATTTITTTTIITTPCWG